MCACVYVCVREVLGGLREIIIVFVSARVCMCEKERESAHVPARERERRREV